MMTKYILRRFAYMLVLLLMVSFVAFFLVQLPPGDYVTTYINDRINDGQRVSAAEVDALRALWGLDRSFLFQYWKWIGNMAQGELGRSFGYGQQVIDLLEDRLGLTAAVSFATLLVTYLHRTSFWPYAMLFFHRALDSSRRSVAQEFQGAHQYSWGDYTASVAGFIGMATTAQAVCLALMLASLSLLESRQCCCQIHRYRKRWKRITAPSPRCSRFNSHVFRFQASAAIAIRNTCSLLRFELLTTIQ